MGDAVSIVKEELILNGLNCAHCAEIINEKVNKLQAVNSANLNFINKTLSIEIYANYNIDEVLEKIIDIINSTEPGLDINKKEKIKKSNKKELILNGLNCAHCAEVINEKVNKLQEVNHANLNFINKTLSIDINLKYSTNEVIKKAIAIINETEPGLDIVIKENKNIKPKEIIEEKSNNKKELLKLGIGAIFYFIGVFESIIGIKSNLLDLLFILVYIVIGYDVLLKAYKNMVKGQFFDENFLMSIATVGAIFIGELPEAVGVILFYRIGEYLQGIAVGKSRKSIASLMEIRPDYANLSINNEIKVVSPYDVNITDTIIVKPGEKIPLDGEVLEGSSLLDTAALTGESVLKKVTVGDSVLSGMINKNGLLSIKVTKDFEESTVSKILQLVENASSKKSKTENFITKFSKYYTPIVIILALLISIVPPVLFTQSFSKWFYRGLVFLVVSCPCALVLSIPLTFFSGIGVASKKGILIKGSNYLEALKNVGTIIFDKTGTLTKGVFDVTKINGVNVEDEKLIEFAAIAEYNSNHPIAKSIISYYGKDIESKQIKKYEEIEGKGIVAQYNDSYILVGNSKLMNSFNILYKTAEEAGTIVYIAVNKVYKGYIVISDKIKDDSKETIEQLKKIGINEIVMLTGDNSKVANTIGKELGIDKVHSDLLPTDKVEKLEEIFKSKNNNSKVAFVGDGINDAPVLARADIGIAMGGLGSDAAIEAADVVLMTDELIKINEAIKIGKKTNSIVWQNIIFALGIKIVVLLFSAGGVVNMWEAIFADVGVALIAVLNAMKIMKIK